MKLAKSSLLSIGGFRYVRLRKHSAILEKGLPKGKSSSLWNKFERTIVFKELPTIGPPSLSSKECQLTRCRWKKPDMERFPQAHSWKSLMLRVKCPRFRAKAAQFSVIYHHHKEERKRHETGGLSTMVCCVVLSLQRPVAGCGEGGHHEGKQGARHMSELIAREGRWLCTFGSSVPCRLRMANAG